MVSTFTRTAAQHLRRLLFAVSTLLIGTLAVLCLEVATYDDYRSELDAVHVQWSAWLPLGRGGLTTLPGQKVQTHSWPWKFLPTAIAVA